MANLYGQDIKFNRSALLKSVKDLPKETKTEESKPAVLATISTSEKLTMKYQVESGDSRSMSLSTPKSDLTDDEIKTANTIMLNKGGIFEDSLKNLVSAIATTTTKSKYSV